MIILLLCHHDVTFLHLRHVVFPVEFLENCSHHKDGVHRSSPFFSFFFLFPYP